MVIYGLFIAATNRSIDVVIMKCISESVCLNYWEAEWWTSCRVGGALDGTVNEYRLNLEDEQQDASNVLGILKESTFQMENRISEVVKKRSVKFYLSLHVNFHLSTDVTFLTNPPAVFSTDTIELYGSSDVHDALNSIYMNLTSAIEGFKQRGSGWVLNKLLAVDLHFLEFEQLHTFPFLHVYRTGKQ